jgi:hypothetical protein
VVNSLDGGAVGRCLNGVVSWPQTMSYSSDQETLSAMQQAAAMNIELHIAALHLPAPEIVMFVLLPHKQSRAYTQSLG